MAASTLPIEDRLANLERSLAALADRVRQRDGAERSRTIQCWAAVTVEPEGEAYPTQRGARLPVWTRDWTESGGLYLPRDRHTSDDGLIRAASLWWCPPKTPVTIAWDGQRYFVCAPPAAIHGRSVSSTSAEWSGYSSECDAYTLGALEIAVYDAGDTETPQLYADDSQVTLGADQGLVITTESVETGKFVTAWPDRHGRWIGTLEPCDLSCS